MISVHAYIVSSSKVSGWIHKIIFKRKNEYLSFFIWPGYLSKQNHHSCSHLALGQKNGTKIKLVFQDSVAQHQKTDYQAWVTSFIHVLCPWSKYCSASLERGVRSHPQAGLRDTPANIIQTLPCPSQNLFRFLGPSLPCQPLACLRTPQKSSIGWSYRTARGSISTPVGLKMGVSALVLWSPFHIPSLASVQALA